MGTFSYIHGRRNQGERGTRAPHFPIKLYVKCPFSAFIVPPLFECFLRPCLGQFKLAGIDFFICKYLKYKQKYHWAVRTQKSFATLQGRYHGVQDVMTTPQPLTFGTRNYTKIKYTTTIDIKILINKNY